MKKLLGLILAVVLTTSCMSHISSPDIVKAQAEKEDILFIGNSMTFYNTLCKVVEGIANHNGKEVSCSAATTPGKTLIYHSTADNVLTALKKGGYEVVVIQDIVGSFDAENLDKGATDLVALIRKYNPDAKIVFYEPWPVKSTLTGQYSMLPYFTDSYVNTARKLNCLLAPAGEAFYDVYVNHNLDFYCPDGKHPRPLGTFVSAATVYAAIYPDDEQIVYTVDDQAFVDDLINKNISDNDAKPTTYSLETINTIFEKGYLYAHAVKDAVADVTGETKYVSVAGEYHDPDAEVDKEGLTQVTATSVDKELFAKYNNNIAIGCKAVASNELQKASNATDGDTGTRWETDYFDPNWIYVDLGSVKPIHTVGFIWEGAYASKYYIQISDDATNWKTVAMVKGTSAGATTVTLDKVYNARYVRMYGTHRKTTYGYSIYEIGVWSSAPKLFVVPKTKITKVIRKKNAKKATVVIKKVTGANKYQVKYSEYKNMKKAKYVSSNKTKVTIKKLNKKKKYFFKVRVNMIINGVSKYSAWSNKIKTKF